MKNLFVLKNKLKIFLSIICFFTIIVSKAQNVQMQSFFIDEGLRKEILLINHYIKELKERKIISKEPLFVRFEIGENPKGAFFNLRFLGNYYRNLSDSEELYYKSNNDIVYIFDINAINFFKDFIDFSLVKNNKNLKNYGEPKKDKDRIIVEMGEMSFSKSCNRFYLDLVTGMPNIDLYYKIKFSVARGSVFYDTGKW